jgi:hypothetical protein
MIFSENQLPLFRIILYPLVPEPVLNANVRALQGSGYGSHNLTTLRRHWGENGTFDLFLIDGNFMPACLIDVNIRPAVKRSETRPLFIRSSHARRATGGRL